MSQYSKQRKDATKGQQRALDKLDMVNHPSHYTQGDIECYQAEMAMVGKEVFTDHCVLSAFKYLWRWRHKNGLQDLQKAQWWLNKAVEVQEAVPKNESKD